MSKNQRFLRVNRRGAPSELLALDEAEQRLRPYSRHYVGVRSIPLHQVVGTDGRARDFDRDFLPRRSDVGARLRGIRDAFPDGNFPPIVVTKLGDAYFVVDGHHRVAIARRQGMATIDAEVTELRARWHLLADADAGELIHGEQYRIFMEESGLIEAVPTACFRFTRPTGYGELLEHVQLHGYYLMRKHGRVLAAREISEDWYEHVYVPALQTFRREGLEPKSTDGDLFLCVFKRRRELLPVCSDITLADATRRVLEDDLTARRKGFRGLFAIRAA
jgi:ParB/Sulfiredoxin domain